MNTNDLLKRGIAAVKTGRNEDALNLLTEVTHQDERNETAWLWLSGVVDTDDQRRVCLQNVLTINPNNRTAQRGLEKLAVKGKILKLPPTNPVKAVARPAPQTVSAEAWRKYERALERNRTKKPGATALAVISVICGLIGLIVFGLPLGVIAVICGIPAVAMGDSKGVAGLVLGIIDIILVLFVLNSMYGSL